MSISYIPEQESYKEMTPFKRFVLQSFPWIDANFDALTNYELMGKIIEYLNDVISNQNAVQDNMTNLYNAFVQLHNYVSDYFDNLDVQQEINNKLDKMAADGSLETLIGAYIQPRIDVQNAKLEELEDTIDDNNLAVNTSIATLTQQINSKVSGTPAGVYATVNALETANPNHSYIYVVTANNYWYYYNTTNSEWTAGGEYLGSEFLDNNIDVTSLYFGNVGTNLFDYQKVDAHGYYKVDGSFQSNADMNGMYIDLRKINSSYISTNVETYSAFLDISKNVITAYVPMSAGDYEIPSGAAYLYVSKAIGYTTGIMVNTGQTSLPFEYYQRKLNAIIPNYEDEINQIKNEIYNTCVTPESGNFIHIGTNMININSKNLEEGIYYSYTSYNRITNANYNSATVIVEPSTSYTVSNCVAHITEWDKNFKPLAGHLCSSVDSTSTFTTNENCKFVRIGYSLTSIATRKPMMNVGDTASSYSDFSLSIDGLVVEASRYQPYTSDLIQFNVSVNQTIPEVTTTANTLDDSQSFENVGCILKLPSTYSQTGTPTRLLMMCHGAGRPVVGAETCWVNTESYMNMLNNFVSSGYAVFDCNGASNSHYDFWGSPVGLSAYRKAYDYVVNHYNVEHEVSIYGFSMGGLTALNLAFQDFPNIKAIALGSPVINLEEAWSTSIAALYSTTTTTYSDSLVAGYNPNLNIKTFNNEDFVFKKLPPIKIWYGGNETHDVRPYVDKTLGQKLVNAISNSGGVAQYRELTGCGHEICYGSNSNAYIEFAYWLNRF